MAGVKGRSGRHSMIDETWFNKVANLTFRQAYRLIQDESYPLIDRVRVCMPLAMKRIPDQVQVKVAHFQLNEQLAQRIAEILDAKSTTQTNEPQRVTDAEKIEYQVVDEAGEKAKVGVEGGSTKLINDSSANIFFSQEKKLATQSQEINSSDNSAEATTDQSSASESASKSESTTKLTAPITPPNPGAK